MRHSSSENWKSPQHLGVDLEAAIVKKLRLPTLILAALALVPVEARADIITYHFSGTVNSITDTSTNHFVPTSIHNGSTFVGTFSFDNSAPGQVSGGNAFYRGTALKLSASVTIDGTFNYTLTTPTASDEIDILGTSFEFFKRGPTVFESFAPNPPFSHFEFLGKTQTDILANAVVNGAGASAGVSDQQTPGSPYYFIGAGISQLSAIPEPATLLLLGTGAVCLAAFWRRQVKAGS
jgi:PEP-CTERM motif